MNKKFHKFILYLMLAIVVSACNFGRQQTIGTTSIIPETVTVTKQGSETARYSIKTNTPGLTTPQPDEDTAYYDGIIVITQYYTFLGHGLYEEAYELLGPSARQHNPTVEGYVAMVKPEFKTVKIVTIQPLYVYAMKQGGQIKPEPKDKKRFYVQIRAWGEGNMSGSRVNGALQDLFITVVWENNLWKIDSFATAPLP